MKKIRIVTKAIKCNNKCMTIGSKERAEWMAEQKKFDAVVIFYGTNPVFQDPLEALRENGIKCDPDMISTVSAGNSRTVWDLPIKIWEVDESNPEDYVPDEELYDQYGEPYIILPRGGRILVLFDYKWPHAIVVVSVVKKLLLDLRLDKEKIVFAHVCLKGWIKREDTDYTF